jgi:hypothetical protein
MLHNKKKFMQGFLLLISFAVVLSIIFMPIFPGGVNGLDFSDDLFNKLSKGSSNFIPKVMEEIKTVEGQPLAVTVKFKSPGMMQTAAVVLAKAGAEVVEKDGGLSVSGDLAGILTRAAQDSQFMYDNDGAKVQEFYGVDAKEAMKAFWTALNGMIKPLQKAKKTRDAKVIDTVMRKAIEPGYNYYGIPAESIMDKIPTAAGLLIFYVVYTLWYGFAIFDMFAGIGLSMSKSKIKKEA